MPVINHSAYGIKHRLDHQPGYILVTPTKQRFVEADGTDVRLDRVRVFGLNGFEKSYLRDKIGQTFTDNLPGTEDDEVYFATLREQEKK